MKCPCKDCITKAICRHKTYDTLVKCPLLKELYGGEALLLDIDEGMAPHTPQKKLLLEVLTPTSWWMDERGWVHEGTFIENPGNDGVELVQ